MVLDPADEAAARAPLVPLYLFGKCPTFVEVDENASDAPWRACEGLPGALVLEVIKPSQSNV